MRRTCTLLALAALLQPGLVGAQSNGDLTIANVVNAFVERYAAVHDMRNHAAMDCLLHERSRLLAVFSDFGGFEDCSVREDGNAYTYPDAAFPLPANIYQYKYDHEFEDPIDTEDDPIDTDGDPGTPPLDNVEIMGNIDVYVDFWNETQAWRDAIAAIVASGWSVSGQDALDSAYQDFDEWWSEWPQAKKDILTTETGDHVKLNQTDIDQLKDAVEETKEIMTWKAADLYGFSAFMGHCQLGAWYGQLQSIDPVAHADQFSATPSSSEEIKDANHWFANASPGNSVGFQAFTIDGVTFNGFIEDGNVSQMTLKQQIDLLNAVSTGLDEIKDKYINMPAGKNVGELVLQIPTRYTEATLPSVGQFTVGSLWAKLPVLAERLVQLKVAADWPCVQFDIEIGSTVLDYTGSTSTFDWLDGWDERDVVAQKSVGGVRWIDSELFWQSPGWVRLDAGGSDPDVGDTTMDADIEMYYLYPAGRGTGFQIDETSYGQGRALKLVGAGGGTFLAPVQDGLSLLLSGPFAQDIDVPRGWTIHGVWDSGSDLQLDPTPSEMWKTGLAGEWRTSSPLKYYPSILKMDAFEQPSEDLLYSSADARWTFGVPEYYEDVSFRYGQVDSHVVFEPDFKYYPKSDYAAPPLGNGVHFGPGPAFAAVEVGTGVNSPHTQGAIGYAFNYPREGQPFIAHAIQFLGPHNDDGFDVIYDSSLSDGPADGTAVTDPFFFNSGLSYSFARYLEDFSRPRLRQVLGGQILADLVYASSLDVTVKLYDVRGAPPAKQGGVYSVPGPTRLLRSVRFYMPSTSGNSLPDEIGELSVTYDTAEHQFTYDPDAADSYYFQFTTADAGSDELLKVEGGEFGAFRIWEKPVEAGAAGADWVRLQGLDGLNFWDRFHNKAYNVVNRSDSSAASVLFQTAIVTGTAVEYDAKQRIYGERWLNWNERGITTYGTHSSNEMNPETDSIEVYDEYGVLLHRIEGLRTPDQLPALPATSLTPKAGSARLIETKWTWDGDRRVLGRGFLDGQEVWKRRVSYSSDLRTRTDEEWSQAAVTYLATTTRANVGGAADAWLPEEIDHPDGTMTVIDRSDGAGADEVLSVSRVVPGQAIEGATALEVTSTHGSWKKTEVEEIETDSLLARSTGDDFNVWGIARKVDFLDGTSETFVLDALNRATSRTDRFGEILVTNYDALGPISGTFRGELIQYNRHPDAAQGYAFLRGPTANPTISASSQFDQFGRLTNGLAADDRDGLQLTLTHPGTPGTSPTLFTESSSTTGFGRVRTFGADGLLQQTTGNSVFNSRSTLTASGGYLVSEEILRQGDGSGSSDSANAVQVWRDGTGRVHKTVTMAATGTGTVETRYRYDSAGRVWRVEPPEGPDILLSYDPLGRLFRQAVDLNGNQVIDTNVDRVLEWEYDYASYGGVAELTVTTKTYIDGETEAQVLLEEITRADGSYSVRRPYGRAELEEEVTRN